MKIVNFSSTLSCIIKCIRFVTAVINKKTIFGLITVIFLTNCASPGTTFLGPVITGAKTGSVYQASISYTSGKVMNTIGKNTMNNLKEISSIEGNKTTNIKEKTLKSEDFFLLVKAKVEKTSKILNLINQ